MPGGGEWYADSRAVFDELNRERSRSAGATAAAACRQLQGHAADGRRRAVPQLADVGRRRARREDRRRCAGSTTRRATRPGTTTMSLRWNQRGVAYWSDGDDARVFWGTGDGYLVAVDAKTGRPVSAFGVERPRRSDGGTAARQARRARLPERADLLRAVAAASSSATSSSRRRRSRRWSIARNRFPAGCAATTCAPASCGGRSTPCRGRGEAGHDTWKGGSVARRRQGHGVDGDERRRGARATSTCRPTPWRPTSTAAIGPGDNLFAESLVCLDVETGRRVWHFQTVHHGLWDYDNPAAPNLLDVTVDGRRVKAVAQISKQGFVYTFDRVTGKPMWPIDERPVPPSDVPGERASPTQPFPTRPAPFEQQGVTDDDLVDFTPELRAEAVAAVQAVPARAAVHAAVARGHDRAARHGRRRQLGRRRGRSRDRRCCTCRRATASASRRWRSPSRGAGQQPAVHAGAGADPADAAAACRSSSRPTRASPPST